MTEDEQRQLWEKALHFALQTAQGKIVHSKTLIRMAGQYYNFITTGDTPKKEKA